jgi:multidrug efflux pump subunit AcrA (membrane-fusion protein)
VNFRFKALQAAREPDELDAPTLLARPRGWIAVFSVLIVVLGAGVWAFLGALPRTVTATGLLTHPGGVSVVQSLYAGQIRTVLAAPGSRVRAGQAVAELVDPVGRGRQVTTPYSGQVVNVSVGGGQVVGIGAEVLTVERTDAPGDRLLAMLFVPADAAVGVIPGQSVDLAVSSAPPAAFGVLKGRVTSVSAYPLSTAALAALLGGQGPASGYTTGGSTRLVLVDLVRDPATASGYGWSTRTGFPRPLQSQAKVTGTIVLGRMSPIRFVLGR